jgi:hypothetical protein
VRAVGASPLREGKRPIFPRYQAKAHSGNTRQRNAPGRNKLRTRSPHSKKTQGAGNTLSGAITLRFYQRKANMNAAKLTVLEAIAQAGKPATTSEVQVAMNLALWRLTHESLESLEKEGLVTRAANKAGTPLWTLKAEGWAALMKGESSI